MLRVLWDVPSTTAAVKKLGLSEAIEDTEKVPLTAQMVHCYSFDFNEKAASVLSLLPPKESNEVPSQVKSMGILTGKLVKHEKFPDSKPPAQDDMIQNQFPLEV